MKKYIISFTLVCALVSTFNVSKLSANNNNSVNTSTISTTSATNPEEIKKNEQTAIEIMRLFHSVQMTYLEREGKGNFGSIQELFRVAYIDGAVANAAGCPKMKETQYGNVCNGDGAARNGYKFQLVHQKAEKDKPATFAAVAIPEVASGDNMTGKLSFFVDESGLIRYSDDPNIIAHAKSKYVGE